MPRPLTALATRCVQRTTTRLSILPCALSLCLVFSGILGARGDDSKSPVLTITEYDKDKGKHVLTDKSRIIDADSELVIKIDKQALRNRVNELSPGVQELVAKANRLRDVAIEGLKLLPDLQSKLSTWLANPEAKETDQEFAEIRVRVARLRLKILETAEPGSSLRDRLNTALAQANLIKDVVPKYIAISRAVFQTAAEEADQLRKDVDAAVKKDAILFQMGAFIGGKQKHLDGWDDYPNDPRTEIGTRTLVLSQADREALLALATTAKGLNGELGTKSITDVLMQQLQSVADSLKAQLKEYLQTPPCVQTVRDSVTAVQSAFEADKAMLQAQAEGVRQSITSNVNAAKASITAFDQSFNVIRDRYVSLTGLGADPSEFLRTANSDLATVVGAVQALTGGLRQQLASLQGTIALLPENVRNNLKLPKALADLSAALADCGAKIEAQAAGLLSSARNMLDSFVFGQHTSNALAEFGDKTRSLELENLPEETRFDLKDATRSSGDSLRITLATLKTGIPRRPLDTRDLLLYPVNWRIDTAVGIIFADHKDKFQAGPSYSWLYKRGSRRSQLYNQLLDFGAGVNISALDFNHDDTPEVGIAFAVSAFRNFLQVGYGINIQQRVSYAFFGIKLPIR